MHMGGVMKYLVLLTTIVLGFYTNTAWAVGSEISLGVNIGLGRWWSNRYE